MSRDAWRRYLPGGGWRYDVAEPGLKANITDVQAAIGRAQLTCCRVAAAPGAAGRAVRPALAVPGLGLPTRPAEAGMPGTCTRCG